MKRRWTDLHCRWRPLALLSLVSLGSAGLARASGDSHWDFTPTELTGGGLATEVAVSPSVSKEAAAGGDSWGLYHTLDAGNLWLPAMKSTPHNPMTGENGTFYYSGLAYSKDPSKTHVVYGLLGRCVPDAVATGGGFVAVDGDTVTLFKPASDEVPSGAEPHCERGQHPRPTGNRLVVDWKAPVHGQPGTEYIYAAGGNGTGVWRSTKGGAKWTNIARDKLKDPIITGMALVPGDSDKLVVTTRTSTIYVLSGIRSAPSNGAHVKPVDLSVRQSGLRFEEVTSTGSTLFAAARNAGVWTSSDGVSWKPTGPLPATSDIVAVGGSADGSLLLAGCVQPNAEQPVKAAQPAGPCIFRSTDGGSSWQPVAQKPHLSFQEWGSGQTWWHSRSSPSAMINGKSFVTSQIAVDKKGHTVYVAGRAGVWKSENRGVDWQPAVVGLQGTMHNAIAFDGRYVETDDVDFGCEKTPPADHFSVADHILVTSAKECTAIPPGTPECTKVHAHPLTTRIDPQTTVTVVPPDAKGNPAQFKVNKQVQKVPDWFEAQVIKPVGLLYQDGWLYIAQCGGGVVLGHPQPRQLSSR